jgi:predicted DNA-binding transcriptional regulator YafY
MLQSRGRMTAKELAAELEVSERTIYRDMDALSSAGVPVYAERGPGGGCSLVESYRTELTGLTQDEVSALFMLSIPTPLVELGLDQDLRSALLKFSAALPDILRRDATSTQQRIHLDPSSWYQLDRPTTHLYSIQRGLKEDCKIEMTYQLPFGAQISQIVQPLGLVAKENEWFFIFSKDEDISVVRLSNLLEVKLTDQKFDLPDEFKLVEFWQTWCLQRENNRPEFVVEVRIKSNLLEMLKFFRAPVLEGAKENGQDDLDDWRNMILRFEKFEDARKQLLSFGNAVEVLSPISLRESVQDFAHQVVKLYKRDNSPNVQVS